MSYWVFCRRCLLCSGLVNTAMILTRPRGITIVKRLPLFQLTAAS